MVLRGPEDTYSVEEIRKSKDKTNSSTNLSSSLPSNFYGLSKDLSSSFLLRKSIEIQKVYFKSIYIVLSGREDYVHLTKHFDPQYKDQLDPDRCHLAPLLLGSLQPYTSPLR